LAVTSRQVAAVTAMVTSPCSAGTRSWVALPPAGGGHLRRQRRHPPTPDCPWPSARVPLRPPPDPRPRRGPRAALPAHPDRSSRASTVAL